MERGFGKVVIGEIDMTSTDEGGFSPFDRAWDIAKESGPYLNRLEPGEHHIHPEGYQDFRINI